MTTSLVLFTTICAAVLMKIFHELYKLHKYSVLMNKIPGPKAYPLLGNLPTLLSISREERHRWTRGLWAKYEGGIFRFWIGTSSVQIILTSAENISKIVSSKKLITKSTIYDFIHPWLGQGLITSTGSLWYQHRKLITPTFHSDILAEFTVVMAQKAEILKEIIESKLTTNPNQSIDMFELLTRCALDVICETVMGININAQTNEMSEYSEALHSISKHTLQRIFRPWLYSDWVYYRTNRGKEFKRDVNTAHELTNRIIRDRKSTRRVQRNRPDKNLNPGKPRRQALLDHLLDACEKENMLLTNDELREHVDTFLFAGHDTTATAMSWALLCIGNNPDVEEKIHQEQLSVFGDSTEPATVEQISELKYLERVIKETLRLFPTVPIVGRTLTEDVEIAGYQIPKNTFVNIQIQAIHCNPKHWPNPEKFDPDRFLPENSQRRHPYAYLPFSAGPRNCIGQKFALLEEKIVLSALLRKWRVKCPVKCQDAQCYSEFVLRPQNGIDIYFTPK